MENKQIFSREISINKSFDETYDSLLKMPQIKHYEIASDNKTMGKVIIIHLISKIEILLTKVSDDQTTIKIMVMDSRGQYWTPCDIATNEATNFENAFAAILDGKPESFNSESVKINGGAAIGQTISLLIGLAVVGYVLYAMFSA